MLSFLIKSSLLMLFPYLKVGCFCFVPGSLSFQIYSLKPSLFEFPFLQGSSLDLDAEYFLGWAFILLLFTGLTR